MRTRTIVTIARLELIVGVRNRWTLVFATVFALLALGISHFGLLTAGMIGIQGFTRTTVSLLNLVLYLVPLVALVSSVLAFHLEGGNQEMLFAQPVRRSEIVAGKLLGLFGTLVASTMAGFGLAGAIIGYRVGWEGVSRYLAFVGLALLVGMVFQALGALVAGLWRGRTKAFGFALFVWFFFVLFYDLLVLGATFLLSEAVANRMLMLALFANPVSLTRVAGSIVLNGPEIFGAAGVVLVRFFGSGTTALVCLILALVAWEAATAFATVRIFRRLDI